MMNLIKKLLCFSFIFLLCGSVAFAFEPDSNKWQFVATDNANNRLYVNKNIASFVIPGAPGEFTIFVEAMTIRPDNCGSFYKDVINRSKNYGNMIRHDKIWSFDMNNNKMLTKTWVTPEKRIWYKADGTDQWWVAEFNYAVRRADELGLKYKL